MIKHTFISVSVVLLTEGLVQQLFMVAIQADIPRLSFQRLVFQFLQLSQPASDSRQMKHKQGRRVVE